MKYNKKKILEILNLPLNDLIFKAQNVHRKFFRNTGVQLASLVSIKTGSCPEDCKYCPQSAHFNVDIKKEKLMDFSDLKTAAFKAKKNGADRFCMGAAWKKLNDGPQLNSVLEMIKEVKKSTDLPVGVGFGIKNSDQVKEISNFSDAIVVGSAIVNEINSLKIKNLDNDLIVKNMIDFLLALSHPLKS